MPTCTVCGQHKEAEAFAFKNKASGRRHQKCKPCMAAYGREHYARNREAYIVRNVAKMRERRRALKQRVWHILVQQACVDCGERDPLVLDFDHVDAAKKRADIYSLVRSGYAWQTVAEEIAKCAVRCANCHRRRTWIQFAWPDRSTPQNVVAHPRARGLRRPTVRTPFADRRGEVADGHRWCCACGVVRPLEQFYTSNQSMCVECFRLYRRAHYRLNRDAYVARNTRVLRERRQRLVRRLSAWVADRKCVDCGVGDPRVLEFDHHEHSAKLKCVTLLAHHGAAWARIEAEIAKCDIRCANCHRRRTATQFNWPKLQLARPVTRRWT